MTFSGRTLVMRPAILFSLILILTGCQPVAILDAFTSKSGYRLQSDIAYGDLPRQQLDVYEPTNPIAVPTPVIVFFYGGSWNSGVRTDYSFVGQQLAASGYMVVIPDYRLYPTVVFPTFLEDGAQALKWVDGHIASFGGDPHRIFLMGHSAGAYNAMMLALDPRYTDAVGLDRTHIAGVVGLAGPYDFKIDTDLLRGVFGAAPHLADIQPVNFTSGAKPPALLITGDADRTVNPNNSIGLERRLRAAGNAVRLREYPGLDHIDIILELSSLWHAHSEVLADILDFLSLPRGDQR
jgi:acetyl esterase/lipase